jgi:hypothetical protein
MYNPAFLPAHAQGLLAGWQKRLEECFCWTRTQQQQSFSSCSIQPEKHLQGTFLNEESGIFFCSMRAQKLNTARVKLGASKLIFYKGSFVHQLGRKIYKPAEKHSMVQFSLSAACAESERRYFIFGPSG